MIILHTHTPSCTYKYTCTPQRNMMPRWVYLNILLSKMDASSSKGKKYDTHMHTHTHNHINAQQTP